MADSFCVGIGAVPAVPGLGPDQGWVGMTVQFLVDAARAGAELGWQPSHPSLTDEFRHGSYRK